LTGVRASKRSAQYSFEQGHGQANGNVKLGEYNKEILMATKEAYQKKFEAQLKEWDARLDLLKAKAQKASADVRIKHEDELESLKAKREAAHKMLEELGKRKEGAWEDIKDVAEKVWDEMSKAMETVAGYFK
jgi:hypothetical protein